MCPKMVLRVPERKFWDHSYEPNIPQKWWNCLHFRRFPVLDGVKPIFKKMDILAVSGSLFPLVEDRLWVYNPENSLLGSLYGTRPKNGKAKFKIWSFSEQAIGHHNSSSSQCKRLLSWVTMARAAQCTFDHPDYSVQMFNSNTLQYISTLNMTILTAHCTVY